MIYKLFQYIPEFKGKKRFARLLLGNFLRNRQDLLFNCKDGTVYLLPNCVENIGFEILVNGEYERETVDFISGRLPQGSTFLDIGANIGSISIPVAKRRADVDVLCIEASPRIAGYLQTNIESNKVDRCKVLHLAISDKDGETVEFFSPDDKFGKGSLAPVFTQSGTEVATITIDRITKDMISSEIGFIKIDIEGFESVAFTGGTGLLTKNDAPDILFEFVDWAETNTGLLKPGDAQRTLISFGYTLFKLMEKTGNLIRLDKPLEEGFAMIYATKKYV